MTPRERLWQHLAEAESAAENDSTREHLEAARELVGDLPPAPLLDCPVCGRTGLPERIAGTPCPHD